MRGPKRMLGFWNLDRLKYLKRLKRFFLILFSDTIMTVSTWIRMDVDGISWMSPGQSILDGLTGFHLAAWRSGIMTSTGDVQVISHTVL